MGLEGGKIRREERCGNPYMWAETPPPARAALMFRVGVIDETLPTSGITHLIEHLALHELIPKPQGRTFVATDADVARAMPHCFAPA